MSILRHSSKSMTYTSLLDNLGDLNEKLLVFFGVLATDKNLDWKPICLDLVEIFR